MQNLLYSLYQNSRNLFTMADLTAVTPEFLAKTNEFLRAYILAIDKANLMIPKGNGNAFAFMIEEKWLDFCRDEVGTMEQVRIICQILQSKRHFFLLFNGQTYWKRQKTSWNDQYWTIE